MNRLDMESKNVVKDNLEYIKQRFPEAVKEERGELKIDPEILIQSLSETIISDKKEKFELTWPGKKNAIVQGNIRTTKTLRPLKSKSVDFDKTKNIYIEGDNLEALKILQESYLNKIKVIYIDPPYNTGTDRIYNDNYKKSTENELKESGEIDENNNKLVTNSSANGRFHSDWLSMMYPRLKLARNLLTEDGAIFVSIDENEVANLMEIMNEIFGESNYIDTIVWDKKASAKGVPPQNMMVNVHEYIVAYQKNGKFTFIGEKRDAERDGFKNPDNDPRGPWRESNIKSTSKAIEDAFTIKDPNTGKEYTNTWAFSKESLEKMIKENRILWKENLPKQKEFMNELTNENKAIKSSWGVFDAQSTTVFLKHLIPEVKFDNPKPINLMKYLISVTTQKNDIILDFFSGSGTTAQAIMEINAENDENRQFIMVQLDESFSEDSEAYKSGYSNICDLGEARIKKCGEKINKESKTIVDTGFRVFKIDDSNMKDEFYLTPDKLSQQQIKLFEDNIKEDRNPEDLITQVLLNLGLKLDLPIKEENMCGNKIFNVDDGELLACFDDNVGIDIIEKIAEIKPRQVVFRDSSFATDQDKVNFEERLKRLSAGTKFNVL